MSNNPGQDHQFLQLIILSMVSLANCLGVVLPIVGSNYNFGVFNLKNFPLAGVSFSVDL